MTNSPASLSPSADTGHFKREIRLFDATMLVVGSMIGSGIFIVSADIARTVGSAGHMLLVWLISGIVTIIAALSYGELAGMMPQAGGQYVYLREAYNPLIAFLYGWTFFLIVQTGSIAAVGIAFAKFTGVLIPWFAENHALLALGAFKVSAAQLLAIVSIGFLTWFNTRGIREGKLLQDTFTFTKTAALLGLIVLGLTIAQNPAAIYVNFQNFWNTNFAYFPNPNVVSTVPLAGLTLWSAIGAAMVGSLFACDAWNNVTFTAAETKDPRRTIAISLGLGAGIVVVLYMLANLAYVLILPVTGTPDATDVMGRGIQFATNDRVGVAAASLIMGSIAALVMAVFIMISTFGCNNGMILTGARVYFAMARDGLFFKGAGRLNSKSVPGIALVMQGVWASVLCLSGRYGDLLDYVIFSVLIFYSLTVIGIFRLRRMRPDVERPYKAFGYPVLPALYVAAAVAICINLLIAKPRYTWPGVIIVLIGIPVYYLWRKRPVETPI